MSRSGTYSYTEARPAGDTNQSWRSVDCAGDYIIVGYNSIYIEISSDRGANWTKVRPHTAGSASIYSVSVNVYGQMMVGHYGRIYYNLTGSWVEALVGGREWRVQISPDGTRMIAGSAESGRLWSWYDGTWTEERPVGDINKNWRAVSITNDGDMLAGITGARIYLKPAGGSWDEIQPAGAVDKNWYGARFSEDGTKHIVCCTNSPTAWVYSGGAYTSISLQSRYPLSNIALQACSCDASCSKYILSRDGYSALTNATMNEYTATHHLAGPVGYVSSTADNFGAISPDASLLVAVYDGGRIWVYEKDTLPVQATGGYYKEFTITRAAGTKTNYKVRLRIYNKYSDSTYLHCEGRANDDFSDIYFKNSFGDTLRHCLVYDEVGASSLNYGYYRYVWVELDEVGASPKTFRMYYGDSGHADSSTAPASFFDQYDDFERGAHGDAIGGEWTVTAGSVKIDTTRPWMGTRTGNFVGAATPGAATIPFIAGDETYVGFHLWMQQTAGLQMQHSDGTTYAQWRWLGSDSGTIKNYTGGAWSASLGSSSYLMWKQFEIYGFDWAADTYDLMHNQVVLGDDLAMQASAGTADVLKLSQLGTSSAHYAYVDQLVICTNCNPFAAPDSESIGAEVLVGEVVYSGPAGVKTWNDIPSASIKTWNDIPWNTIKTIN